MSGSHFPSQRLFATKAAKDRSLTRAFTSYFKYFLQKCQHMRIAMTGQPASHLAAWPLESQCNPQSRGPTIQQSSIQPWPAAPIKAKKLSSQKAAAIAVADMEKPLADFMRFSTVSFLYLLFLYFELPWRGSINYLGNVASYPLIYSLKCIIHFNFHTSKMTQYLSN